MFDKFTDKSRRAIIDAKDICEKFRGDSITTSHLLWAILRFTDDQPAAMLERLGVSADDLIEDIENQLPKNKADIPFTSNAASVMRLAAADCEEKKCTEIDLTDLLIALLNVESCSAAQVLNKFGITKDKIKQLRDSKHNNAIEPDRE